MGGTGHDPKIKGILSDNSAMKVVQTMQGDQGERIGRMPHTTLYI